MRDVDPTTDVEIAPESPRQDDVVQMIRELDAYIGALYPAESNHLLDVESLTGLTVRFFVARRDGDAIGCGALRVDGAGYGEVKRMFVRTSARGLGTGRRILGCIEDEARREGLRVLRLETGVHQPEALGLYRRAGFVERDPFGDYGPDPLSVFMEKRLYA